MIDLFGKDDEVHFENLPVELQGKDLNPDDMEKLRNDFPCAQEQIILCFTEAEKQDLANFLGLPSIDTSKKRRYSFAELKEYKKNGLL